MGGRWTGGRTFGKISQVAPTRRSSTTIAADSQLAAVCEAIKAERRMSERVSIRTREQVALIRSRKSESWKAKEEGEEETRVVFVVPVSEQKMARF